jgi:hypothetical protein
VGKHRRPGPGGGTTVRLIMLSIGLLTPGVFGVAAAATTGGLGCLIAERSRSCPAAASPDRQPQAVRSPVPRPAMPRVPAAGAPVRTEPTTAPARPDRGGPAVAFAPYVDANAWPEVDLARLADQTGIDDFTVGFVSAGHGCSAAWGGAVPLDPLLDGDLIRQRLVRLRDEDGRAAVSMTGPEGADLATQCTKVDDLARQYRAALDAAGSTDLDVFIPAREAVDATAIERRSKALAELQWERRDLRVSLTLPLSAAGLSAEALGVLNSAVAGGVDVAYVNLFAGDLATAGRAGGTGRALVQAVTRAHSQLRSVYRGDSEARLWGRIGVTPVIGAADSGTFGLADARMLRDWARARRIGRLSMWTVSRDAACDTVADPARNGCSGVPQSRGAFMEILSAT